MVETIPPAVLIADDDVGHATLVKRNLRRAGLAIEPVHLHDGQELLDYLHRRIPYERRPVHDTIVIVLDLKMPRLSGLEVLQTLKRDERFAHMPVFVLTTTDNSVELERCYALGAAACLVKPVDFGAFGDTVQRLGHFLMAMQAPGEALSESGRTDD